MRVIRFQDDQGRILWGEELGDGSVNVITADEFQPTGETASVSKLLAPVEPVNIFCIGANYREHAKESGADIPKNPVIFMKPTTAVNNPGDPILLPKACVNGPEVDYECELAVIIGKECSDVSEEDALNYVRGYTAANDVSARKWQKQGGGGQWIRGKSFNTFCPLGPAMITADEMPDPQTLRLGTTLNGQVMQDHTTADMIFSVRTLISFISRDTTLLPNTVILTGTPQGVGFARTPPVTLNDGDEVTIEVEKIGKLTNPVQDA